MVSWKAYYVRRYIRILLPMAAAIALSAPLGLKFGLFSNSILWSLLAEEIYYFLYPAMLKVGLRACMPLAWAGSLGVILINPEAADYIAYGPWLTWLLALPCWLLGCRMAERLEEFWFLPVVSIWQIWNWRAAALALGLLTSLLRFHTPIGFPWTLNLFAVFAALWLEREIRFYRFSGRKPWFEQPGEASYSVYLTHLHANLGYAVDSYSAWSLALALVAVVGTVFYYLIERPSYRLARAMSKRWSRPRQSNPVSYQ